MADDEKRVSADCQLQVLYEQTTGLSLFDRVRNAFLRLGSALRRRIARFERRFGFLSDTGSAADYREKENQTGSIPAPPARFLRTGSLRTGDIVRVRSLSEIRLLTDEHRKTEGLTFMAGMEKYCGRLLRVKKKVRTIFDERAWKMLKIKNTYILENAVCNSRGLYEKEGCDRCCFFFWKDVWLEGRYPHDDGLPPCDPLSDQPDSSRLV